MIFAQLLDGTVGTVASGFQGFLYAVENWLREVSFSTWAVVAGIVLAVLWLWNRR